MPSFQRYPVRHFSSFPLFPDQLTNVYPSPDQGMPRLPPRQRGLGKQCWLVRPPPFVRESPAK